MVTSARFHYAHYVVAIIMVGAAAVTSRVVWEWTYLSSVSLLLLALALALVTCGVLYAGRTKAREALRERDARMQRVSEQIPGGLWSTDTDLRVTSGFGAQSDL